MENDICRKIGCDWRNDIYRACDPRFYEPASEYRMAKSKQLRERFVYPIPARLDDQEIK